MPRADFDARYTVFAPSQDTVFAPKEDKSDQRWKMTALMTTAGVVFLGVICASQAAHISWLERQQAPTLPVGPEVRLSTVSEVGASTTVPPLMNAQVSPGCETSHPHKWCTLSLPHKWALAGVTPVAYQLQRGSCWLFAAVSLLEHSYRAKGVARGWLDPSEFLRLSQQAFGIAVLDTCRKQKQEGRDTCLYDGDEIWGGKSTQGGEVTVLYILKALQNISALPFSVCPYTTSPVITLTIRSAKTVD